MSKLVPKPENQDSPEPDRFAVYPVTAPSAGKYQFCTRWEGLLYADSDFDPDGRPKPGALPAPVQGSLEADARAAALIDANAQRITDEARDIRSGKPDIRLKHHPRWLQWFRRRF